MAVPRDPTDEKFCASFPMSHERGGELAADFSDNRPAVVEHASLFTRAGLAQERTQEDLRACSGGGKRMRAMIKGVKLGQFWEITVDAFQSYAEQESGTMGKNRGANL